MADEPNPMLEKAGAVVTLLAAVALAWVAIDTLRPRREDAPDDSGD
jgi:hypothetical protein